MFLHLLDQKTEYNEGLSAIEVTTFSWSKFALTLCYTLKWTKPSDWHPIGKDQWAIKCRKRQIEQDTLLIYWLMQGPSLLSICLGCVLPTASCFLFTGKKKSHHTVVEKFLHTSDVFDAHAALHCNDVSSKIAPLATYPEDRNQKEYCFFFLVLFCLSNSTQQNDNHFFVWQTFWNINQFNFFFF